MTKISALNTSISFYSNIRAEGERKKNDVYRLLITDFNMPIVKMYGIRLYKLDQVAKTRYEFLSNPNVIKYGFHNMSTEIRKAHDGFIVTADIQGYQFQSESCSLDTATLIYDILVHKEPRRYSILNE